jgi:hypothetical protein
MQPFETDCGSVATITLTGQKPDNELGPRHSSRPNGLIMDEPVCRRYDPRLTNSF